MTKESSPPLMRIAQLAQSTNLSSQTIQYYLLLGLIRETARTPGGQRLFDPEIIPRIKLIHQLNQTGYALRDIRETFLKKK